MRLNSTHPRRASRAWRARLSALAATAVLPALAACGAGTSAQTNQQYDPGVGVNWREGEIYAINTLVVANDSGQGTIVAALVNQSDQDDRLTGVTAQDNAGDPLQVGIVSGGVDIPPSQAVQLANEGDVSVSGDGLKPGSFIDVHLSFEKAASIDLKIPVVDHSGDFESVPINEPTPNAG